MGIGPAPAIRGVLKKSGYKLEDIDIIDVSLIYDNAPHDKVFEYSIIQLFPYKEMP